MLIPCFRKFHLKRFLEWAGEGKSNNENTYTTKKVFPRNSDGLIVPTFKFYKQFLCNNKELQFVGMFKKNKEEENIMILNDNYEIEGMTKSLAKRLGIYRADYKKLLGLNLLIFMPDLVFYTKF